MNIAVASGKGGTGKTTIAVNCARIMRERRETVTYVDCDVEEPNGALFIAPKEKVSAPVTVPYPCIDENLCTACGLCVEICRYNAIALVDEKPMVFSGMCRSCGGCSLVCPVGAVYDKESRVGSVEEGNGDGPACIQGMLDIGSTHSTTVIREVKRRVSPEGVNIIDCPPGTSRAVMTAVNGAGYVILVTEPTPFGLHDLKRAEKAVGCLGIPCGVVINRCDIGTGDIRTFCRSRGLRILGEIPHDNAVAAACSRGELPVDTCSEYRKYIERIIDNLVREYKKIKPSVYVEE